MYTIGLRSWLPISIAGSFDWQATSSDAAMTADQAAILKELAQEAYELDAFNPNLTRREADLRIAMLKAKLKLLDGPPHVL